MTEPKSQHPYEAAYHGLAAIALAGVVLLVAVPALQLAFWLEASQYKGFSDEDKKLAAWGGYLGAFFAIVLCLTSVVTAARGIGAAERTGEPNILCDVGLYLGLLAAAVWVGCGVAWHSQAWRFIKRLEAFRLDFMSQQNAENDQFCVNLGAFRVEI